MPKEIILCQQNGYSCMGCCGYDYKTKAIRKAVKKNTKEFHKIQDKIKFRDRADKDDLRKCGACRNIILTIEGNKEKVFCPLHPALNEGKDLRKGHCNTRYWCNTMKQFRKWDDKRKQQFLDFVNKKQTDWVEYSMGMDSGAFLREFLNKS